MKKKISFILISSLILFVLNAVSHFIFNILPYNFIGVLFPVNESIFQHLKMIFTSFILFYLLLFFANRKFNFTNLIFAALISSLSSIALFLIIYLPIYLNIGENMIFTFILLFIFLCAGQFLAYLILNIDYNRIINIFSFILIVLIFIINASLTFKPLKNFLFFDPQYKTYDIVYK